MKTWKHGNKLPLKKAQDLSCLGPSIYVFTTNFAASLVICTDTSRTAVLVLSLSFPSVLLLSSWEVFSELTPTGSAQTSKWEACSALQSVLVIDMTELSLLECNVFSSTWFVHVLDMSWLLLEKSSSESDADWLDSSTLPWALPVICLMTLAHTPGCCVQATWSIRSSFIVMACSVLSAGIQDFVVECSLYLQVKTNTYVNSEVWQAALLK